MLLYLMVSEAARDNSNAIRHTREVFAADIAITLLLNDVGADYELECVIARIAEGVGARLKRYGLTACASIRRHEL